MSFDPLATPKGWCLESTFFSKIFVGIRNASRLECQTRMVGFKDGTYPWPDVSAQFRLGFPREGAARAPFRRPVTQTESVSLGDCAAACFQGLATALAWRV